MRGLLFICAFFISFHILAQKGYTSFRDKDTHKLIYQGQITFKDLEQESEFKWIEDAKPYRADIKHITYLCQNMKEYTLVVVMGTWCADSHDMIPKLYKVLQHATYPMQQLTMYGVDYSKKGRNKEELTYKIENVPTIILYKDGVEAGRIVETVKKTVEADLADIIHEYEAE